MSAPVANNGSTAVNEFHDAVLVFGGCYSNLQATQSMRLQAEALSIPAERVFCTGDVVAYCAQPEETVELLRDWGIAVVMGNCEESLGFGGDDCGCGFAEGSSCAVLSDSWFRFSQAHLSASSKAWMRELPRTVRFVLNGKSIELVHGAYTSINRFLFASMPEEDFYEEFALSTADVVVGGHAGLPFARSFPAQGKTWANAGVIGMPANDGSPRTWYALLKPMPNGALSIEWHSLEYDAEKAYEIMQEHGLKTPYAQALLDGLWPSMDVLPLIEQQQRGKKLFLGEQLVT